MTNVEPTFFFYQDERSEEAIDASRASIEEKMDVRKIYKRKRNFRKQKARGGVPPARTLRASFKPLKALSKDEID